MNSLMKTIDNP